MNPPRIINISNAQLIAWSLGMLGVAFLVGWVIGTVLWGAA
jgi:hypothetical protein